MLLRQQRLPSSPLHRWNVVKFSLFKRIVKLAGKQAPHLPRCSFVTLNDITLYPSSCKVPIYFIAQNGTPPRAVLCTGWQRKTRREKKTNEDSILSRFTDILERSSRSLNSMRYNLFAKASWLHSLSSKQTNNLERDSKFRLLNVFLH